MTTGKCGTSELPPQAAAVLTELRGGKCTTLQLMRATGALRVGAIIHDLRVAGFDIHTEIVQKRTRYRKKANVALYTLRRRRPSARAGRGVL